MGHSLSAAGRARLALAQAVAAAVAEVPAELVDSMEVDVPAWIQMIDRQVSGWGVYSYDFLLLPVASYCSSCLLLVSRRSIHT